MEDFDNASHSDNINHVVFDDSDDSLFFLLR